MRSLLLLISAVWLAAPTAAMAQARWTPDGTTSGMVAYSLSELPDSGIRHGLVASVAPVGRFDLWAGVVSGQDQPASALAAGARVLLVRDPWSVPVSFHVGSFVASADRSRRQGLELGISGVHRLHPRWAVIPQVSVSHERSHRDPGPRPLAVSSIPVESSRSGQLVAWTLATTARIHMGGPFHTAITPSLRSDPAGRSVGLEIGLVQIGAR